MIDMTREESGKTKSELFKRVKFWAIVALSLLLIPVILFKCIETLDATNVMVITYPNGTMKTGVTPGFYAQWFGSVTKYPLRSQYSFSSQKDEGAPRDESLYIRFNDGGTAHVSGVVSWEMPTDEVHLINIHRKFGNLHSIDQQIIRPTLNAATFSSGTLLSSTESAAEKRSSMLEFMQDQAKDGVYSTRTISVKMPDPITGIDKTVNVAEIVLRDGMPLRKEESATKIFGINLLPMTISAINYEGDVEHQIIERQKAIQGVQIAQANSLKAEQDAITAEKQGQALAAKAKWDQEAIKAQKVTEAQQWLEIATLKAREAEQYKAKQILEGQGNAEKKRLEMAANGALDQKLEAYVKIQGYYAEAMGKYTGAWVPQIVTGSSAGQAGSGAQQMIDLLSIKAAKDLGISMTIEGADKTVNK